MDHADDGDDDDVFVYMGGDQQAPRNVTHVRVHKSVKIISRWAFYDCINLVSIEMHDGVEIIEEEAFFLCNSLREVKLLGVRVIGARAFKNCTALEDVKFGYKLESIGDDAFYQCNSLRNIKLSKIRVIGDGAFCDCKQLTEVELSEDLETVGRAALAYCPRLRRITIPLKDNLLQDNSVFVECDALSQVDLVGGVHKTVSSLFLESWRNEMNDEIDRVNRNLPRYSLYLPTTNAADKTAAIRRWMERVIRRIQRYKSEHYALLKNNMTQLELTLWKVNLPNIDAAESRHEARVTCGANIIIPHVLSFLNDNDEFPLADFYAK